jgi:hypothetical protein
MGYQVYERRGRDCGYGIPAECDHPKCHARIDRGLSYLCGYEPGDEQYGCGLYFCEAHLTYRQPRDLDEPISLCPRCYAYRPPYTPKPDLPEWIEWKLTDESWQQWRDENAELVEQMKAQIA